MKQMDIVERLTLTPDCDTRQMSDNCVEAAAEITRLRSQVERSRRLLMDVLPYAQGVDRDRARRIVKEIGDFLDARTALEDSPDEQ